MNDTAAHDVDAGTERPRARGVATACVLLTAGLVLARCLATSDPFPYWSGDPLVQWVPATGLTPAVAFTMDVLGIVVAIIGLLAMDRLGARASGWMLLVLALPGAVLLTHIIPRAPNSFENVLLGAAWLHAASAGLLALRAGRDERLRALTVALLVGLVGALAVRGVVQVFVEHPQTLASFRRDQEAFFRAQGWSADSAMAQAFVRRMEQAEATGWFGLSNVLATLASASLAAWCGMAWASVRAGARGGVRGGTRRWVLLACGAGAALSLLLIVLAGSKGGFASAGLGVGLLVVTLVAARRGWGVRRALASAGPVLVGLALLAVAVRGMIGERLGELSILFRWFYAQAAGRIIAENPWTGVGPAGFKDAYLLAKPALSPEEVSSPHSVLLDWAATLGVGGMVLGAGWLFVTLLASRALLLPGTQTRDRGSDHDDTDVVQETKLLALLLVVPTALAAWTERAIATPEGALVRVLGLVVAIALAAAAYRVVRGRAHAGIAAAGLGCAALAAAAHQQIELTAVTAGASAWCWMLLGLAAGWASAGRTDALSERSMRGRVALLGWAGLAVLVLGAGTYWGIRVWTWEVHLTRAARACEPVTVLQARRDGLAGRGVRVPGDTAADLARDLGAVAGVQVPATQAGIDGALTALRRGAIDVARQHLGKASGAVQTHFPTSRAVSRLAMLELDAAASLGEPVDDVAWEMPVQAVRVRTRAFAQKSQFWSWLGTVHQTRAGVADRLNRGGLVASENVDARACWGKAAELAPHELLPAVRLAELADGAGDVTERARWAARALAIDANLRLDPLEQLGDAQRSRLEAWAAGGALEGGGRGAGAGGP